MNIDSVRGALRWTWLGVAAVLIYAGFVMFTRWQDSKAAVKQAEQKELERNKAAVDLLGKGEPKVLMFYSKTPVVGRGETGSLCYGVVNVKSVRIEPEVEPVNPSLSRCIEIKPLKTTSYTITASDDKGRTVSEKLEIQVR